MNKYRRGALFAFLGLIVAFYAGEWLFDTVLEGPRKERLNRRRQLEKRIEQREKELAMALKAGKQLDIYESQSLPSSPDQAVSLYRAWLFELVDYVKFDKANVDAGNPMNRKGMYYSLDCSIRGTGTLQQLTTFLFEFYNAGHLHQIRSINIVPLQRQNQIDLSISIEALILPTADREDQLTLVTSDRLAFQDLANYHVVSDRNLFGYSSEGVHQTDQTFLTAVVRVNDQPQAWFTVRSADQVLKLSHGDPIAVGLFQGTIEEIQGNDVIVESDGERWLMTVGESLAQAFALPPEY